jgi:sulfur relay (sulfurtransferase) DsrF/TusC family protein
MAYDVTGRLHEIFDEQQVSEKFRKREFVLEVQDGQYPEHIKFQMVQDKTSLIDPYKMGDEVKVTFNLRGRGFNKNGQMLYFTNLEAWKIEPAAGGNAGNSYGGGHSRPRRGQPRKTRTPPCGPSPRRPPSPATTTTTALLVLRH